MKIYIICPVRNVSEAQMEEIFSYVEKLKLEGNEVFYPQTDAPQSSDTGYEIVMSELNAIKECDRVDIFWDVTSKGSHFDLGMAIALGKKLKFIKSFQEDVKGKSYLKVIGIISGVY